MGWKKKKGMKTEREGKVGTYCYISTLSFRSKSDWAD